MIFFRVIFFLGIVSPAMITGRVLDIDSKDPIIGANIEFRGQGTATDEMGVFFI